MKCSLGLDIGYSAVKAALLDEEGGLAWSGYAPHRGRLVETARALLQEVSERVDPVTICLGAITGGGGRMLSDHCGLERVNEIAALVEGGRWTDGRISAIVSIGGQGSAYIVGLDEPEGSRIQVAMNSNCASGTGSFLEEQASRLGMAIEDYASNASLAGSYPRIAGRCSVFAKTDITHHQQEGVPVANILLGLAYSMVKNYRNAVLRKLPLRTPILFAGGVARNETVARVFREILGLGEADFLVPEHAANVAGIGAAVLAARGGLRFDLPAVLTALDGATELYAEEGDDALAPLRSFGLGDAEGRHECLRFDAEEPVACHLGIDVGSTSTNLALVGATGDILGYRYLRTAGNPVRAVREGLASLRREFMDSVVVAGVGVTGSGRVLIGRLVGADSVKDEITAQARAAVWFAPGVDTVFEIGGQDSKYIALKDGRVVDFQMNKVCAAGTGSFLEEQAKKLGVDIRDFARMALEGKKPVNLGERCTVFIESSVGTHLSRGTSLPDIAAGLCYSIVRNYLNRVVGRKPIGERILLQGGLAFNQGVLNAFRALTGKDVQVAPFFSVTGAYGAALLAREEMRRGGETAFKGFDLDAAAESATADPVEAGGPGGLDVFSKQVADFVFEGYDGTLVPGQKTVGLPRALFTYGMFPMFFPFFKSLGCNVLLSDPTSEKTIALGQEFALDEMCFPVKLVTGHVAELVSRKVDYLFFPDLYTVNHPGSKSRQNYGCAYMQLAFKIVDRAMSLADRGIRLLAPTIAFSFGQEFMRTVFFDLGRQLGAAPERVAEAMRAAMEAYHAFEKKIEQRGRETLERLDPKRPAFAVISKIYGVADPVLNLGIPGKLMEMGHQVVPFYDLPETDIFTRHPNMYWPFGQHILEAAQVAARTPNLHPILLTHHGCGPDTVTAHYVREIMGDKSYLAIEVDEHSSGVGVQTRLEAFLNSLASNRQAGSGDALAREAASAELPVGIWTSAGGMARDAELLLPHLYPYSQIGAEMLAAKGRKVKVLPRTSESSLLAGRRHTTANEYFSLAALLGDVLQELDRAKPGDAVVLMTQSEGAEVDGQYGRFIRLKLDEEGHSSVGMLSPFIEDLPFGEEEQVRSLFLGLLAGDVVLAAPSALRGQYLGRVRKLIRDGGFSLDSLMALARDVRGRRASVACGKRILAVGEALILFNDFMNDHLFRNMEESGCSVLFAPLSEALWSLWRSHAAQDKEHGDLPRQRLALFRQYHSSIAAAFQGEAPFTRDLDALAALEDETVGHYSGAFGRYRGACVQRDVPGVDGVITVSSMYENTGISLGVLQKGFRRERSRPVLNLTFDGLGNESDRTRLESFLHYI